jgi:polysaccharide biosynthesis/export protein
MIVNYKIHIYSLHLVFASILFSSCATYRQNIMFRTSENDKIALKSEVESIERNYVIKENDILDVQVFTNNGERLIDPNMEFEVGSGTRGGGAASRPQYLVQKGGMVRLPMVGLIKLDGYTLNQADSVLQKNYEDYYKGAFVYTKYLNKRVFVLGGIGGGGGSSGGASSGRGGGRVVALENEDTNLIEVLTIVGGVGGQSKVTNIRLIRGDLKDPYIEIIDLSTIQGMKKATLKLEPNDIIYVEPMRRPVFEAIRDYSSIVSFIAGLGSLTLSSIVLIRTLRDN